jgi:hypothetical protein
MGSTATIPLSLSPSLTVLWRLGEVVEVEGAPVYVFIGYRGVRPGDQPSGNHGFVTRHRTRWMRSSGERDDYDSMVPPTSD